MRTQPIPLVGGAYADETRPWSQQDTVNYLPSSAERAGTRSEAMLKTPPGLYPFLEVPDKTGVRGTHNAEGRFFAVIQGTLYQVISSTEVAIIGSVPGVGRVSLAHNQISLGNEVMVVNGSAGYVYNTRTGAFGRVTDPGFPGAKVVRFIGGYIVGIEPQGRYAFNSAVANATQYNTLDRFTSEYKPDPLVGLASVQGELLLLSSASGEFFELTTNTPQPFRSKQIRFDKGCAGAYTIVEADSNVWWLGSDGYFYKLDGYSPRRISTRPIEQAIRGLDWSQAFGYVWEDAGHTVVYWTFPGGRTWGYDIAEGEWHRRESYGLTRWRANTMTRWNDAWYAGDFQSGRIWRMDWDYPLEGDQEFISERTIAVIHDHQNRVQIPRMELVMDTGQQLVTPPVPLFPTVTTSFVITGDLPDGLVGQAITPFTYQVTGGVQPYGARTIVSGSLPPGLSMDAIGTVTGVPTTGGDYLWTVSVTDSDGNLATHDDGASIAFSPDIGLISGAGTEDDVFIYSGATSSFPFVQQIDDDRDYRRVSFNSDGSLMAVASTGALPASSVEIYERQPAGNYTLISGGTTYAPTTQINALSFSPDSVYLAVGGNGGNLRVLKRVAGVYEPLVHLTQQGTTDCDIIKWSPSGEYLITSNNLSGTFIFRRAGDVFTLLTMASSEPAKGIAWKPDSSTFALAKYSQGILIYTVSGDTVTLVADGPNTVNDRHYIRWSLTGNFLYLASRSAESSGNRLTVWQWDGAASITEIAAPAIQPVTNVSWIDQSVGGNLLAVAMETLQTLALYECDGAILTPVSNTISARDFVSFSKSSDYWQP